MLTRASNILIPVALVGFALGWWQIQRMEEKKNLEESFDRAAHQSLDDAITDQKPFSNIQATGQYDVSRHILLDNKVFRGRAGVHVLTPFTTASGTSILVNRGWKPLPPDRSRLPDIETPSGAMEIRGILAPPPENRQMLGEPDVLTTDKWPQLVTYLQIGDVAEALQKTLPNQVVWLDASEPAGFDDRDWSPSTITPQKHQAYAVQWFALGLAAITFWAVLLWRDTRRS